MNRLAVKAQQSAVVAMSKVDAITKSSLTNEQKRAEAIKDYKKSLDDIRKVDPKDSRLELGLFTCKKPVPTPMGGGAFKLTATFDRAFQP